ncbi:branched-chain amino acid transport system permease protein [Streptosporangium becharense]|uniref:Branched-chain amino acid transport system permease protein n=1 Tax=Streptosporangium becharense TaxID=1816182 RepID=A0A7W9IDP6_9ACTN|nr:branched-chain amino acid ABC transporter permease [Streptosporangium becharense]MBB2912932.1 branched-chain amino acid transport system permease protein [Streptosporangium becharense]MBB5818243.1 branched-chain amino acid transport system permease protein [Streptosporangium becharense]
MFNDFIAQLWRDFTDQFWPATIDGLSFGSIYALIALGYTMVYGVLRLINFAHSEVFMIGTFGAMFVPFILGINTTLTGIALVGIILAMILAGMLASAGTAIALERIAYRPLRRRGASRLAALISAIGASIFLQELFALLVIPKVFERPGQGGRVQMGLPRLMERTELFSIFGHTVRVDQVFVVVAAVAMMIALDALVNRTKIGRGIRATAQNPEAAVLMGVDIDKIVRMTFLIGGAMAGVAGALYLISYENTNYLIGFLFGIKAFTAAVLGGIGNLRGALVGGVVLGLVENYGAIFFGSDWKHVISFTILVLVLMFRPTGILGESLQQARA